MARNSEQQQLPSMSQFFNTRDVVVPVYKVEQMVNKPLILNSYEIEENDYGMYVVLDCTDVKDGSRLKVQAYQDSIVKPLMIYRETIILPCNLTFKPYGKSFHME